MTSELVRAKVNLCLHVVGQRDDGMHLLDSIVVFPNVGDVLKAKLSDTLTLTINGEFGAGLSSGADNLILQAARYFGATGVALTLQKNLPVASGIGGGSADAAATIRALCGLLDIPRPDAKGLAVLGADVPVCLNQIPARMTGIGEGLEPLPQLPTFWMVLANAGAAVDTGVVFSAMKNRNNSKIMDIPTAFPDVDSLFQFLAKQRNDMEEAALETAPEIGVVLSVLNATKACALARMSGSGGTCFGLYATQDAAEVAAQAVQKAYPDWWVVSAKV